MKEYYYIIELGISKRDWGEVVVQEKSLIWKNKQWLFYTQVECEKIIDSLATGVYEINKVYTKNTDIHNL